MNPFGRRKTDQSPDQQAIARYRYLLKTVPQVLQQIAQELPASERPLADQNALSPQALARLASRAEMRQPGSVMAGSLLSSIAGAVIGSMIARQFFDGTGNWESAEADPAAHDHFDMGGDFDV